MTVLRAGTRGSDLALRQTRWVADRLRAAHRSLSIEEVVIKTHGDVARDQRFDRDWPVGGFVGAIEQALSGERIDFAVHSYKDLPTASTPALMIAAVPTREVAHDVLVTREPCDLDRLPPGFRVGTSSPRRAAQFRRLSDVRIVPIRGNVLTRIERIERDNLDGVVLAAAGLKRLGDRVQTLASETYRLDLPADRFVPSPGQGALAIQTREDSVASHLIKVLDDETTRRAVDAERAFLRTVAAGCHVPIGALATLSEGAMVLHGQLFSEDGGHMVEGVETSDDPTQLGTHLANRLLRELSER